MRTALVFIVGIVLGLAPPLYFEENTYTVTVTGAGHAVITQEITITAQESADSYSYIIPFPITHLEVYSDRAVQGEFVALGRQTEVVLHLSLKKGESAYCICEYVSWDIIFKEGAQWWVYIPAMEESVTLVMPEGAVISYLVTEADFPSISESERKLHLFWEELPEDVYVYYELSAESANTDFKYGILAVAILSAAGLAGYMVRRRTPERVLNEAVLSVLNERERNIVEYLHETKRARQAKISRALDIPKTSLSKILIRMEKRGVVKRNKDGNFTYCELDENVYQ